MYQGYAFVALYFTISFELWWGGQLTLLLKIENIPLQETHVFHMFACSF